MSVLQANLPDHACYGVNSQGVEYLEFSCVYNIEAYYASFEKYHDPMPVLQWMQRHPAVPIATVALYVLLVFGGQAWMRHREPWQHFRTPLAVWNFALAAFSLVGFVRTAPQLAHNLLHYSMRDTLCLDPRATFGSGSTGLWVQLFVLSKFPELLDTFFIVIHKKPLLFLHWYHHVTVLLYCWHSYATKSPPGIFFVVMNYAVHSSMYCYYGVMAVPGGKHFLKHTLKFNPVLITAFQISQMAVGVAVTLAGFYMYHTNTRQTCPYLDAENNTAAFVMYGSYLFLFLQFFVGRYSTKKNHGGKQLPPHQNGSLLQPTKPKSA